MTTNHHNTNIRKWIKHHFNEKVIEDIIYRKHMHKPTVKLTAEIEKKIVDIAIKNPREYRELPFSTWSLRVLSGYITKELNFVNTKSHAPIINILKHWIRYRQSK
jgi:hypothetical protein